MKKKVLFICNGNLFRSQVAACLFKKMFPNIETSSAGIRKPHYTTVGDAMRSNRESARTIAFLKKKHIYIMKNVRRQVTYSDIEGARVVFVMEHSQKRKLVRNYPRFASKIFLLGQIAGQSDPKIIDPVKLDLKTSIKAFDQIKRSLENIKKRDLLKSLS